MYILMFEFNLGRPATSSEGRILVYILLDKTYYGVSISTHFLDLLCTDRQSSCRLVRDTLQFKIRDTIVISSSFTYPSVHTVSTL